MKTFTFTRPFLYLAFLTCLLIGSASAFARVALDLGPQTANAVHIKNAMPDKYIKTLFAEIDAMPDKYIKDVIAEINAVPDKYIEGVFIESDAVPNKYIEDVIAEINAVPDEHIEDIIKQMYGTDEKNLNQIQDQIYSNIGGSLEFLQNKDKEAFLLALAKLFNDQPASIGLFAQSNESDTLVGILNRECTENLTTIFGNSILVAATTENGDPTCALGLPMELQQQILRSAKLQSRQGKDVEALLLASAKLLCQQPAIICNDPETLLGVLNRGGAKPFAQGEAFMNNNAAFAPHVDEVGLGKIQQQINIGIIEDMIKQGWKQLMPQQILSNPVVIRLFAHSNDLETLVEVLDKRCAATLVMLLGDPKLMAAIIESGDPTRALEIVSRAYEDLLTSFNHNIHAFRSIELG